MTRPRPALLVLGAGAIALGIGTVGIATAGSGMHVESVGARPAVTQEAAPTSSPGSATPNADDAPDSSSPYRTLARTDATQLPRPDRTPRPVQISIPAIDVRIPVEVVGLDQAGQVEDEAALVAPLPRAAVGNVAEAGVVVDVHEGRHVGHLGDQ